MTTPAAALRALLARPGIVVMPGIHDALSARIAEQVGFEVTNVGGHMVANAIYGIPDVGLVTMSEMADQIRRVTEVTTIPAIADADTGYGNEINVIRTVRSFESAGAAGLYLEDQVFPKQCSHTGGSRVQVIDMREMISKVHAALEARRDPDFVIIARTDARHAVSFDEAVRRAEAYAEAGADMIFVNALASDEELARLPQLIDAPLLVNMHGPGGLTPLKSAGELEEMGYKLANYGDASTMAVMQATLELFEELKATGTTAGYLDRMMGSEERQRRVGLPEIRELEARYARIREEH
jgi:2,3-dimethylmalate lyase